MPGALPDNAGLDADAKKRKRDSTPEHLRAQSLDPEEKLPRSSEPRSRNREDASEAWTLRLPRTLVSHLRDLCERGSAEHFITVRAKAQDTSITLLGWWTVETSRETPQSSHVSPRWMQEPMLLRSEQDGELWVTMHTHPRAAIKQALNVVPSLRRRQQLARTNPLLYVPSLADVNNMLRYGMHASMVRRRPSQCPSSAHAPLWGGAWPALAGSGRSSLPGGEIGALGAQPAPRLPERAASKVADSAALVHPGTCTSSSRLSIVCRAGLEPQPSRLEIDLPLTRASPALDSLPCGCHETSAGAAPPRAPRVAATSTSLVSTSRRTRRPRSSLTRAPTLTRTLTLST